MRIERDVEDLIIERLREKFPGKPGSWIRRALRRFESGNVRQISDNVWVVSGDPSSVIDTRRTLLGSRTVGTTAHASRPAGDYAGKPRYAPHSRSNPLPRVLETHATNLRGSPEHGMRW
ncbi:hypothetical protein [Vulcanisaeta sp. JCM 14467]|uniref:hypothetical protein n=1 Tax=Vulcanisaeta sp. JCM 14467 TaxID=1295370 RepID=UPI002093B130|nr:hypothetical protein [Vulcanisaeta sp. JCM 14467]